MEEHPFVRLNENDRLLIEMQYPILGMKHGEPECFVREEVAEMLKKAERFLPDGLRLVVWDAWRPFDLQAELYDAYKPMIIKDFHLADLPKEEQDKFISQFVSIPKADRAAAPLHTTGGALDVTLVDKQGNVLPMGTKFDAFSDKTNTDWFKGTGSVEEKNRKILYDCMIRAGFVNLPSEWWHFEYGDRNWSEVTGKDIIYDGVFTKDEILSKLKDEEKTYDDRDSFER